MARKFSNEKIARKIKNSYMVGGEYLCGYIRKGSNEILKREPIT